MLQLYNYKAQVLRVIDGDTIEAQIDYGCRTFGKWRVRLLHINAPEIHSADPDAQAAAIRAKAYLQLLIEGKEVVIHTEKADSWDRLLGEIYLADVYINQKMIDDGYAVPYK